MNTPKMSKLPSGAYRIQVMVNGQRRSFTSYDKKELQRKAKEVYAVAEVEKRSPLTVGKAIDKYISMKSGVLSPSTIMVYKRYRKNYLQGLMNIGISDLTQEMIQIAVTEDAASGLSPKTVKNAHGLLSSVLKVYRPNFSIHTTLPQKQKHEVRIPTEEEITKIWTAAKGSKYEIPILLASWLGLRMSEIKGLKKTDISDGHIHIQRAIVRGDGGEQVKSTKSISGDRWIKCPEELLKLIEASEGTGDGYICNYFDTRIYSGFISICKKAGVKPCRFHDLRHFAASEAHSLGVPDKYAMHRMGHKTDNMLKTVYQHVMRDKEDCFADVIDAHMSDIFAKSQNAQNAQKVRKCKIRLHTKLHTDSKKPSIIKA